MLSKFRRRAEDEKGFTLIELLVVILIIGILAAIAIPSFLNQKGKANDAAAKSQARTAQTAAETYGTDNNGYASMTVGVAPDHREHAERHELRHGGGRRPRRRTATRSHRPRTRPVTRSRSRVPANGQVTRSCTNGTGAGSPGGCVANKW